MFRSPPEPTPPAPPPNPVTYANAANAGAAARSRDFRMSPTLMTSGSGVTSPAMTTGKTLLGM